MKNTVFKTLLFSVSPCLRGLYGFCALKTLPVLFFFIISLPGTADFLEDSSAPFVRVDTSVEHGRYPVAIPLKGGKLRVLFIGRRDVVGLVSINVARRLDCTFETVLTESRKRIGIPPEKASSDAGILSSASVEKLAGQLFREQWDVIWLDFELKSLPEGFRLTVLDRVEKGAGLVYVGSRRELADLKVEGRIDVARLGAVTFGKWVPDCPGKLKRGLATVIPALDLGVTLRELSDYFTTAVNTILFAAGRFDVITVEKIPEVGKIVEQESIDIMNFRIHLSSNLDTRPLTVFTRYRNEQGDIEAESGATYKVEKGKSFVIVPYPFLPTGAYSVDISIADSDSVIALAGTTFTVVAQRHMTDLEFWEKSAREGGLIIGKVKASSPYTDAMRVRVELLDCRHRLIERNELIPNVNLKEVDFAFRIGAIKERSVFIRASLIQSNRIVQRIEKPAFVRKQFDFRRFSLIVSDSRPSEATAAERFAALRDAGVTALDVDVVNLTDPHDIHDTILHAASSGFGVIPRITRIASSAPGNVMVPVITDLEYNDNLEKKIAATVDTLRHISPLAFSLGRDNMLTPFDIDVSFSETDIESFTSYLKDTYETVQALNSAWHTNFSSFENARPVKLADAVRANNYASWLDTRLHMEEVFTQVHYGAFEAFKPAESAALVGIDGFENALSPFRGYNLFELTGFLTMAVSRQDAGPGLQGDRSVSAMLASFAQPGSLTGLSLVGDRFHRGAPALLHAAPWQSLFLGMNSIWWNDAFGGIESALTPQLTLSPAFSAVAEETREITSGIDVLLLGGTRLVDPVGILYSPVSKMAAVTSGAPDLSLPYEGDRSSGTPVSGAGEGNTHVETGLKPVSTLSPALPLGSAVGVHAYENAIRALYLACQDAGYTPNFVSDDQLTGDWLTENHYKVLILPYIQAMADETVSCIEQFVQNGGSLIADMRTGVMDGHLFTRKAGVLDELFGISQGVERTASRVVGRFQPIEVEGGLPADTAIELCLADPSVKAREGSYVMADVIPRLNRGINQGAIPAVIVNRYGFGTAIFLNMGMEGYENVRARGQEKKFRDVISWCLFTGGLGMPYCSVSDSTGALAPKISVTVFRDDVFEYVGLLPDPLADRSEYSNTSYFLDLSATPRFNRGATCFVYDVRKKEFLGANLRVPLKLAPGKAELFALVPYRVKELDMRLKTPVVQVGGTLEYTVSVVPQPPGLTGELRAKPARHVFSIDVTGPDGTVMPSYSESLEAYNGILKSSLTVAPGDATGRWILGVTDCITGKRAERAFMVMATGIKK